MTMRDYLAHCYQLIVASEPLLEQSIRLLSYDGWEGDLRVFYVKHLEDERDHAKWLLEDLQGYTGNLHYGVAAVAGTAYYLILHVHPVALLGYMLALEGSQITTPLIEAVAEECGEDATRTLRLHAQEDPKHAQELEAAALMVPDEWQPLIANTRRQIETMLKGL